MCRLAGCRRALHPGPWSLPLIGDLHPMVTQGIHDYFLECQGRYGKLFKVYMGSRPLVVSRPPAALPCTIPSCLLQGPWLRLTRCCPALPALRR